jgi:hypothetical protein
MEARMARIPEGREVLQVTVDSEVATILRVQAALRRITPGRLIEDLVRQEGTQGGEEKSRFLEALRGVDPTWSGKKPVLRKPPTIPPQNGAEEAPRRPQEARKRRRGGVGDTMTWEALLDGLEASGRTQKELREFLGLSNVSQWAKDGVPTHHVPKIKDFLGLAGN